MTSQWWVVTGASRGIGLELVRQLLGKGQFVVAGVRNPEGSREMWELKGDYKERFRYHQLDTSSQASVDGFAKELNGLNIAVLVNNAGVFKGEDQNFRSLKFEDISQMLDVNTFGVMRVTKALLAILETSTAPKVVNVSSLMGSIQDNHSGSYYGYRMSKCALNMFNQCFKTEFPKITSLVVHPGWVQTDMGGEKAPLSVADSVKGLVQVMESSTLKDSGKFLDYTGKEIPW